MNKEVLRISPRLQLVEAAEYDRERGDNYAFLTTHNGNQFYKSLAVSRLELEELRDQLTQLLGPGQKRETER